MKPELQALQNAQRAMHFSDLNDATQVTNRLTHLIDSQLNEVQRMTGRVHFAWSESMAAIDRAGFSVQLLCTTRYIVPPEITRSQVADVLAKSIVEFLVDRLDKSATQSAIFLTLPQCIVKTENNGKDKEVSAWVQWVQLLAGSVYDQDGRRHRVLDVRQDGTPLVAKYPYAMLDLPHGDG
jgi:hypothetical protein